MICPPFVNIPAAVEAAKSTTIGIGAQDVFWLKEGAYTGEVSAPMLAAAGCRWVIIGHSERRQYFHETDETVFKKTVAALDAGLNPIVCVGERLDEREANATEAVCAAQFEGGLGGLTPEQFARIVIAYEPVWAIGTGKTATPEMAAAAHRIYSRRGSQKVRCLGRLRVPDSLRGKRQARQREGLDGTGRNRRRFGRWREPRSGCRSRQS